MHVEELPLQLFQKVPNIVVGRVPMPFRAINTTVACWRVQHDCAARLAAKRARTSSRRIRHLLTAVVEYGFSLK